MATRFIGKNLRKKVVRPMKNSAKYKNYFSSIEYKVPVVGKVEEQGNETVLQKENKRQKKSKDMVTEDKLTQMETIVGETSPKGKVKIEKADKGLFERTEGTVTVMSEDNKMLLND